MNHMIIVENVDAKVTASELTELLNGCGGVKSVQLAKAETPGTDTTVAFVCVQSAKHGKAIIAALDGQTHWGHSLKIKAMKNRGGAAGPGPGGLGNRAGLKLNKGDGRSSSHAW